MTSRAPPRGGLWPDEQRQLTAYELQLEPERSNVALARGFVMHAIHCLGRDRYADVAQLLTSELVTNAVLHAGTPLQLSVSDEAEGLRVEVTDESAAAPRRRRYGVDATTGRGLALVDVLASAWGTRPANPGKTVWFTLQPDALPS